MKVFTAAVLIGSVSLALLASNASAHGDGSHTTPTPTVLASGLSYPWSLAFLPDGRMLITERSGQLRVLKDGALLAEPVRGLPKVHYQGQGGLFEVLPAPDFATSQIIYLSYAAGTARASTTRVARAKLVDHALQDVEVVFSAVPERATSVHYGGRMAWLADGSLLIALGDGFDYRERAQSLADHLGSIVRIRADGGVPADNPFAGRAGARAEIYSYGHRNVQGLVVINVAGEEQIYAHEHGPRGGDELNRILPGRNYGWPLATFGLDYSGATISPYTALDGFENPLLHWMPSIAPSGLAYVDDGESGGRFLVGALAERRLREVRLAADGTPAQRILLADLDQRLREVRVGPDGALYLLTDSADGQLLRLTLPASTPNSVGEN